MLRRLLAGAVVAGVAVLVYRSLPDIKRYMRMRNM
jgi:hypothetical protein